jgi:hypothetical protein
MNLISLIIINVRYDVKTMRIQKTTMHKWPNYGYFQTMQSRGTNRRTLLEVKLVIHYSVLVHIVVHPLYHFHCG